MVGRPWTTAVVLAVLAGCDASCTNDVPPSAPAECVAFEATEFCALHPCLQQECSGESPSDECTLQCCMDQGDKGQRTMCLAQAKGMDPGIGRCVSTNTWEEFDRDRWAVFTITTGPCDPEGLTGIYWLADIHDPTAPLGQSRSSITSVMSCEWWMEAYGTTAH